MALSLRLKLTLAYVALAIVCTFALGAAGIRLQQQTYLTNLHERLVSEADLGATCPTPPSRAARPSSR